MLDHTTAAHEFDNFSVPKCIHYELEVADKLRECDKMLSSLQDSASPSEIQRLIDSLNRCFDTLKNLARPNALLHLDFAPYSFTFTAGGLFGGMIFHGPLDGYGSGSAPTFSVTLEKVHGWSLHT